MLNRIKILNSKFTRNLAITSGGLFIAYLVNFFLQPWITRIYTPEMIGEASLFISIVGILSAISSLGYDRAILPADNILEAFQLLIISFLFLVCFDFLVLLIFQIGFESIFSNSKYLQIKDYWLFIPALLLIRGSTKLLQNIYIKLGEYSKNSVSEIIKSTLPGSLKITLGKIYGPNVFNLLISTLIGSFLNSLFLIYNLKFSLKKHFSFDLIFLKRVLIKYKKYPLILNWNSLINSFGSESVILLLAAFYSSTEIGFYSLARGILTIPIGLISESVYKVFLPHLSIKKNNNNFLSKDFKNILFYLSVIGFLGFSLLFFIAPWLFETVFGENWRIAGVYGQILCPWFFMYFINKPANSVIQLFQSFKFLTIYNICMLILRVISISIGYYLYKSAIWSLIFFSLVGFLGNIIYILHAYFLILKHDKSL